MERCSSPPQLGKCRVTMRRDCTQQSGGRSGKGAPSSHAAGEMRRLQHWVKWPSPPTPCNLTAGMTVPGVQLSTAAKHCRLCECPAAGKGRVHYVTATAIELAVSPSPWGCRKEPQRLGRRTPGPELKSWFCDLAICLYPLMAQFPHLWNKDGNTNTRFLGLWWLNEQLCRKCLEQRLAQRSAT